MNFNRSKSTAAKPPVIRKKVVQVPIKPTAPAAAPQKAPARPHDPDRWKPSVPASRKPTNPAQRALSAARGTKRKKSVTPQRALFSSDDEDEGSSDIGGSDSDASRKRIKSSVSSVDDSAPRRNVASVEAFGEMAEIDIVHGADATSGEYARKFKNPWLDEVFECTELQYPSKSKAERFELKFPKNEHEDYKPWDDITETIKMICTRYFPDDLSEKWSHDETGYDRRFNRAWIHQNVDEFIEIVEDFNKLLSKLLEDGTVQKELRESRGLDLEWVKRILDQIYARTVSPKVETLRAYENGSDNVYGELLPPLCSDIFRKTKLNHEQVFIDLGSGVGNVVLQAALEIGCESWGVEMMPNPCDLADLQAKEFPARSRLWGLSVGKVNLRRGDFTTDRDIGQVLKRADVVLVNNQAFTPELNATLRDMFLDLKEGCQVVSLKPFVPAGHKIQARTVGSVANVLVQQKFEYFSHCVSWGASHGDWYIATKDSRPLKAFMKQNRIR